MRVRLCVHAGLGLTQGRMDGDVAGAVPWDETECTGAAQGPNMG